MLQVLLTKISYMSNIMVYYGFMHEWAELFKQLWKKSRNEFDTKTSGIVNVIMKNSNFKCKLEFKYAFSKYILKFLLTNGTAKLYRLGIFIESNLSIKSALKFIKNNPWPTSDQFYSVTIRYHSEFHNQYHKFLDEYTNSNLNFPNWSMIFNINWSKIKEENIWLIHDFKCTLVHDKFVTHSQKIVSEP